MIIKSNLRTRRKSLTCYLYGDDDVKENCHLVLMIAISDDDVVYVSFD